MPLMMILIAIILLVAAALALLVLRIVQPHFRFSWLIAVGAGFLAWVSVLIWRVQLPFSISLGTWAPTELLPSAPMLAADQISWVYALCLVTLALATLLTETVREGFPDPGAIAISVGVCALGLVAVTAGNPLTLLLVWAALDLFELVATLSSTSGHSSSERVVAVFAIHAVASVFLMLAQVLGSTGSKPADFAILGPGVGLLLLVAAGLRLGVLPLHVPSVPGSAMRRGWATSTAMTSAAASLVLLSRIPSEGLGSASGLLILLLGAAAALYASWMWLRAPDELAGRPFWFIGIGSLALFSTLRGNPQGAAAWGAALILSGGALFLSSVQQTWLNRLLFVGVWALSALPFSLTAIGWQGQAGFTGWAMPLFIVVQALMLAGFVRHALRPATRSSLRSHPAWTRSVYPAGIGLLILIPFVLGLWGWDGALQLGVVFPSIAAGLLMVVSLWAVPRFRILNPVAAHWLQPSSTSSGVDRLFRAAFGLYRWLAGLSLTLSGVLEGEAGLMWSLLFLVLLILLIVQRNP